MANLREQVDMEQLMRITFRLRAEENERFTDQFARSLIGKTPRINAREYEGGPITRSFGTATVVGAQVVDGGRAVDITYEMARQDTVVDLINQPMSFAFLRDAEAGLTVRPIPVLPVEPDGAI